MVTSLNLETGEIGGATWEHGYPLVEDFLDSLYEKYSRLIDKNKCFKVGGTVVVDWMWCNGELTIKRVDAEYNGSGKDIDYTNSILRHWIFCYAMSFSKVLGVVSVKQQQIK